MAQNWSESQYVEQLNKTVRPATLGILLAVCPASLARGGYSCRASPMRAKRVQPKSRKDDMEIAQQAQRRPGSAAPKWILGCWRFTQGGVLRCVALGYLSCCPSGAPGGHRSGCQHGPGEGSAYPGQRNRSL